MNERHTRSASEWPWGTPAAGDGAAPYLANRLRAMRRLSCGVNGALLDRAGARRNSDNYLAERVAAAIPPGSVSLGSCELRVGLPYNRSPSGESAGNLALGGDSDVD